MQVRTSNSGRAAGVAKRTPLVASVGTRNAAARLTSACVVALLVAAEMPLQLDVHAVAAEDADQAIEQAADAVPPAVERGAAGERDQPGRAAVELLERQRALAFGRAQLHPRDQATEIPVALGAFAEDGQARRELERRVRPGSTRLRAF